MPDDEPRTDAELAVLMPGWRSRVAVLLETIPDPRARSQAIRDVVHAIAVVQGVPVEEQPPRPGGATDG